MSLSQKGLCISGSGNLPDSDLGSLHPGSLVDARDEIDVHDDKAEERGEGKVVRDTHVLDEDGRWRLPNHAISRESVHIVREMFVLFISLIRGLEFVEATRPAEAENGTEDQRGDDTECVDDLFQVIEGWRIQVVVAP